MTKTKETKKAPEQTSTRVAIVILQMGQYSWITENDSKVENVVLAFRCARHMRRAWKGYYKFQKEAVVPVHIYDISNSKEWNFEYNGKCINEKGEDLPFIETIKTVL